MSFLGITKTRGISSGSDYRSCFAVLLRASGFFAGLWSAREMDDDDWATGVTGASDASDGAAEPEAADPQASTPRRSKARKLGVRISSPGAKKKVKKDGKEKAKGERKKRQQTVRPLCFIIACEAKCKPNNKFCHHHFNVAAGLRAQAIKANKLRLYEATMSDPDKATSAANDWDDMNPPGCYRKALIDWGAFEKKHGQRSSVTFRSEDVLMDQVDYVSWKKSKGMSKEQATLEWAKCLTDPNLSGEGSGASRKLYICAVQKRLRDETNYVDAGLVEGSNQKKNMTEAEKEKLKSFTSKAASFNNEFLQKAMSAQGDDAAKVLDRAAGTGGGDDDDADIAVLGPSAFSLHSKELDGLRKTFNDTHKAMSDSITAFNDMDSELRTRSIMAYLDLAKCREHISTYVLATDPLAVKMPTGLLIIDCPQPPPGSVPDTPGPPTPLTPAQTPQGKQDRYVVCKHVPINK